MAGAGASPGHAGIYVRAQSIPLCSSNPPPLGDGAERQPGAIAPAVPRPYPPEDKARFSQKAGYEILLCRAFIDLGSDICPVQP